MTIPLYKCLRDLSVFNWFSLGFLVIRRTSLMQKKRQFGNNVERICWKKLTPATMGIKFIAMKVGARNASPLFRAVGVDIVIEKVIIAFFIRSEMNE